MIHPPIDVLEKFPVRKSRKQKAAFREAVCSYAEGLGYDVKVEKGSFGSRNIVIGDPENAKHLITAHYDTCARMFFPNLITPCNFWTFLLYQLFTVVLLLIPAIGLGILTGVLTGSVWAGQMVYAGFLLAAMALMLFGPANPSNANDNTSGVVSLLKLAVQWPSDQRNQVCFVLFDLEEAGLLGSSSYRSSHKKATQNQLVWNIDCVGEGDQIVFFPKKNVKQDAAHMEMLRRCCTEQDGKRILIRENGFSVYPSDQANFPLGIGIAALRESRFGLYLGKIHTKRDTILDKNNVNILCSAILSAITDAAGE